MIKFKYKKKNLPTIEFTATIKDYLVEDNWYIIAFSKLPEGISVYDSELIFLLENRHGVRLHKSAVSKVVPNNVLSQKIYPNYVESECGEYLEEK